MPDAAVLTELSDVSQEPHRHSSRLAAIISHLPIGTRTRTVNALANAGVLTLVALCAKKRSDMRRMKDIGSKVIDDVESALAAFGLSLAGGGPSNDERKTAARRVSNPAWLRQQLRELLKDYEDNISEDQDRAGKMRDDVMCARYDASVDCNRHFRKQILRILGGKTAFEAITETIKGAP